VTRRRSRRSLRRLAAVAAMSVSAVACSLPVDERATPLEADDVPPDLQQSTTTTTTTLPPTTTTIPSTESTVGESTTTTVAPVATQTVRVYYTLGISDDLLAVQLDVPSPVPVEVLVQLLESPSGVESFPTLRTWVRPGLIEVDDLTIERGTATIPLDATVLGRLSDQSVDRAIAQIVLTFTSFVPVGQGGTTFVLFEVDGEGFPVFVPSAGGTSEPGEPLLFEDFADLILTTPVAPTTVEPPTVPPPRATTTTTPPATTTSTTATSTTSTTTSTTTPDVEPSSP
jgi:hypothetical protein